jgi:hypothetical protein
MLWNNIVVQQVGTSGLEVYTLSTLRAENFIPTDQIIQCCNARDYSLNITVGAYILCIIADSIQFSVLSLLV